MIHSRLKEHQRLVKIPDLKGQSNWVKDDGNRWATNNKGVGLWT
jgi:hypothetical protein